MGTRRRIKYADPFEPWPLDHALDGVTITPRHPESARAALSIFRALRIPDLPDRPRLGDACKPWALDFVASLFGGLDPATHEQSIREAMLLISKKNCKTLVGAGVLLTALLTHQRENDECALMISATKEVAGLAFNTIGGMVRCDEALDARLWVRDNIKEVFDRDTHNTARVSSLDSNALAGKRAAFVLVDELHLLGKLAKADAALQEAQGAQVSRPEGFTCHLTTQSDAPPAGVFLDRLTYARQVASGEVEDPSFLACLYEPKPGVRISTDDDFLRAAKASNPNLGVSVSEGWLLQQWRRVNGKRDGSLQVFLSKHCNIEIGLNLRTDRWAGADFWESREVDLSLDELLSRSEVVEIGVDGGGLDDLLGAGVMGRERGTGRKLSWGHAWCNRIVLERRMEIAPRLQDFERDGDLDICDAGQDIEQLATLVKKILQTGRLDMVAADPYGLGGILEALQGVGVKESQIVGVSQGWKLGQHIQTAERWLSSGELSVARQGLMRWCVGNARIEQRSNGILVTKAASGKAKIDPVIALINCVATMSQNPETKEHKKVLAFSL